jgi:hypothetical protein
MRPTMTVSRRPLATSAGACCSGAGSADRLVRRPPARLACIWQMRRTSSPARMCKAPAGSGQSPGPLARRRAKGSQFARTATPCGGGIFTANPPLSAHYSDGDLLDRTQEVRISSPGRRPRRRRPSGAPLPPCEMAGQNVCLVPIAIRHRCRLPPSTAFGRFQTARGGVRCWLGPLASRRVRSRAKRAGPGGHLAVSRSTEPWVTVSRTGARPIHRE